MILRALLYQSCLRRARRRPTITAQTCPRLGLLYARTGTRAVHAPARRCTPKRTRPLSASLLAPWADRRADVEPPMQCGASAPHSSLVAVLAEKIHLHALPLHVCIATDRVVPVPSSEHVHCVNGFFGRASNCNARSFVGHDSTLANVEIFRCIFVCPTELYH